MIKKFHYLKEALENFGVSWSSDSKWVAYVNTQDNGNGASFIYDTEAKKSHQVTSGFYSDNQIEFDPDGKYVYISSNREGVP